jgi:calcineurin-like phosphoesterase family protein
MIYFISDTHFGHANIIKFDNRKDKAFKDINEMNQFIIDKWNSIITDEDTVYCLGDFSYKISTKTLLHIFNSLNGKIILIEGNHDARTLKANKIAHRFESVHKLLELNYNKIHFVLCHYPLESWRLKERKSIHLHGHVHGNLEYNRFKNRIDVSCEAIDYTPISIEEIIKKVYNETNRENTIIS